MTAMDYPSEAAPWPEAVTWARRELRTYLEAAADTELWRLPTRCAPWDVRDLTAHLAVTFRRFGAQLDRSRAGDLEPPFAPDELSAENLREVRAFHGDPLRALHRHATRFLDAVDAPDELIGHQFGPIPVALQVSFGLNELAVHHDDLARAAGGTYRPPPQTVDALAAMYAAVFGLPDGGDSWDRLLHATGRNDPL